MSDSEIRRGVDRMVEDLRAELAAVKAQRDRLRTRVNELESLRCANPSCQLCHVDQTT